MQMPITPVGATTTLGGVSPFGGIICQTGVIRRAEEIGFIQRGTHRLVDLQGNLLAALRSDAVNLFALEGQFVTVCGVNEGRIEGVLSIAVTQVFRATAPGAFPPPAPQPQVDPRLLLLLFLLSNPALLRLIRPELLFALLRGGFR